MSRFLQKLEHCTCKNAEVLHDNFQHFKFKIEIFGIGPNSREAVTVVVLSFTCKLGY